MFSVVMILLRDQQIVFGLLICVKLAILDNLLLICTVTMSIFHGMN